MAGAPLIYAKIPPIEGRGHYHDLARAQSLERGKLDCHPFEGLGGWGAVLPTIFLLRFDLFQTAHGGPARHLTAHHGTWDDVGVERVVVYVSPEVAAALEVRASAERRSRSACAAVLLENALADPHGVERAGALLGGGEPNGGAHTPPAVAGADTPASPPLKFKPDPKPGH